MARSSRPPKPTERDVAAADSENALETGHRVPARDRLDERNGVARPAGSAAGR